MTTALTPSQENVSLIREINDLRRELKAARTHINDLDAALGLNRKNNDQTRQLVQLITTTKANPMLEKDYTEAKRVIEAQRMEIQGLRLMLNGCPAEKAEQKAGESSGNKLPPIEGTC